MPEEQPSNNLSDILESIDDYNLNKRNYNAILKVLESKEPIKSSDLDKLIALCYKEFIKKNTFGILSLKIVSALLKKLKNENCSQTPDLVSLLIAVLNTLNKNTCIEKIDAFKALCFEILVLFPDETLISAAVDHASEFYTMVDHYCQESSLPELVFQPMTIILKLLHILPPLNRDKFVEDGIDTWLSSLIPTVFNFSQGKIYGLDNALQCLEELTDVLVPLNYFDNIHWQKLFEYISIKYPVKMLTLLNEGHDHWHRLWMVCIKLLKNQITNNLPSVGSPINALLRVEEKAFKMDVKSRSRAFKSWNILIDNFSSENTEDSNKRMKLLLVPLMSNNAKVEESALAKFDTWWHLIVKFHPKIPNLSDVILLPFLYFCFGNPISSNKSVIIPGLFSNDTKKLCMQGFVNILGHYKCMGCAELEKVESKLITTTHLIKHWKYWLHSISMVIKLCVEVGGEVLKKQLKCAWKSFIATIAELPQDNTRNELLNEVLDVLQKSLQECCFETSDVVINILIPVLFEEDENIRSLLKVHNDALPKTQFILIDSCNNNFYSSCDVEETIKNIRIYTDYLVQFEVTQKTSAFDIENLPNTECGLIVWTAYVESIMKYEYITYPQLLCNTIKWPLQLNIFSNAKKYTSTWLTFYDFLSNNTINESNTTTLRIINDNLLLFFFEHKNVNTILSLTAIISLIKHNLNEKGGKLQKQEQQLLKILKKQINDQFLIPTVYLQLLSCLVLLLDLFKTCIDVTLAKQLLTIVNTVLKITPKLHLHCKIINDEEENNIMLSSLERFLQSIHTFLKVEDYCKLNSIVLDGIKENALHFSKTNSIGNHVLSILNTYEDKDTDIKELIKNISIDQNVTKANKSEDNTFTTPNKNSTKSKSMKKGVNIVNTVVEGGEEFVVVKSNWKFNPKKLTENQKEKLQRKREDIPALYQDLSQSQDEFKLRTWKTDSNDASSSTKSTSTSMCTNDVNTISILKNIPTSDFVPKMIENIKNDEMNPSSDQTTEENKNKNSRADSPKTAIPETIKDVKTPRMALKDRVFRNVRNLIENSNLSKDNNQISLCEDVCKTPLGTNINTNANIVNSAPSKINTERPTRVKKTPKKFDDSRIFGIKRRRHSSFNCGSQTDNDKTCNNVTSEISETSIDNTQKKDDLKDSDAGLKPILEDNDNTIEIKESEKESKSATDPDDDKKHKSEQLNATNQLNVSSDTSVNLHLQIETMQKTNKDNKDSSTPTLEITNNNDGLITSTNRKIEQVTPKSTTKKNIPKKSRIEKVLAIDMVEGNPFLNAPAEKRLTRHTLNKSPTTRRKMGTIIADNKSKDKPKRVQKVDGLKLNESDTSISIAESQPNILDVSTSQDIIESSQDSSVTTISMKSNKINVKRVPIVAIEKMILAKANEESSDNTQRLLGSISNVNGEIKGVKDDSELPENKTVEEERMIIDLTEDMNTEPVNSHSDLIEDMDTESLPPQGDYDNICLLSQTQSLTPKPINDDTHTEIDSQDTANADTQPLDPNFSLDAIKTNVTKNLSTNGMANEKVLPNIQVSNDDVTTTVSTTNDVTMAHEDISSPLKDDEQRKKDFLNNTLEISPIKIMSPVRDEKTPSPETSSDYVIIKLTSPVQANGEPIEKCSSPEIFTEDKISPDKRDLSPPREEITVVNSSPSSALSLKKNRPQVRSGGRGAQMLGLCVPDRLQSIGTLEKNMETEEIKRTTPINTTARRNLRILYNPENHDSSDDTDDSDNFLKFKRNLPPTDSSPAIPILKRKHADMADEATPSPASKRKRVSFHDPPVSTTVCVKKYIEPCAVRSPQSSAIKRQEKQLRSLNQTPKSQRRLDKVLSKTIESFVQNYITDTATEDTQMTSLEQTPVVEIVKASELNDIDPICPKLVGCDDPIENIATELSSPAMKSLLVKEFEGKIETVGDLAKMTELEVNRLCIKAPKVEIAKKVLNDYLENKEATENEEKVVESVYSTEVFVEDVDSKEQQKETTEVEMQTDILDISCSFTQTDDAQCSHSSIQTELSGNVIQEDAVASYLTNKPDILNKLDDKSFEALSDTFIRRLTSSNSCDAIDKIIGQSSTQGSDKDKKLSFLSNYLCDRFESKDLVLFCSTLLKKVYDKP